MPVQISALTHVITGPPGRRCTFDKSGTVYVVLRQGLPRNTIRCFKKSNGSFSEQDTDDKPAATGINASIDCRFDGTLIHVVYYELDGSDLNIKYVTFDTSSDQWGTPENITAAIDDPDSPGRSCAISLDTNNKPHVMYTIAVAIKGTDYANLKYKNKVGAGWSAEEDLHAEEQIQHQRPTAGHESDNRFVVVWEDATNDIVYARTRTAAGAWDVAQTVKAGSLYASLSVDVNDVKHVALTTGSDLHHCSSPSGASQAWTPSAALDANATFPAISCNPDGSRLYIIYGETVVDDVLLVAFADAAWSAPIQLQGIPGATTVSSTGIQDPSSAEEFDYIFRDVDAVIWWWYYPPPEPEPAGGGGLPVVAMRAMLLPEA